MTGQREKTRDFNIEESGHPNGDWRLEVGSHRHGKQPCVFLLTDDEARALRALLDFTLSDD